MTSSARRIAAQLGVFVTIALVSLAILDPYYLNVAILALLTTMLCVSWNLTGGFGGMFSFAHTLFIAFGAILPVVLADRLDLPTSLGLFLALIGSTLGAIAVVLMMHYFQLGVLQFALATIALAEMVLVLVLGTPDLGGASGLSVISTLHIGPLEIAEPERFFLLSLGLVTLFIGLSAWFMNSRFGYYLVAARDNSPAALAVGVPVLAAQSRSIVLSSWMTCVSGFVYVQYSGFVDPYRVASPLFLVEVVLFATLGGLGTLWGPVLGACIFVPLTEILRGEFGGDVPGLSRLLVGSLIVLVVLGFPKGLVGIGPEVWGRVRRRMSRVESQRGLVGDE